MFSQASVRSHPREGYPNLANWGGGVYPLPRSGLGGGYPSQVRMGRGVPHPRSGHGDTPSQVRMGGGEVPHPKSEWRGTPSQVRTGGGVPHPRSEWGGGTPYPGQVGGGTLSGTAWRAIATPRPVCLLRSRRRTFLLKILKIFKKPNTINIIFSYQQGKQEL